LIEAGAEREGWIAVAAGLKEGEKVLIEGNLHLLKFFKQGAKAPKQAAQ
jgi:cobalt-zinc-cadmium efflux system membrane fusion protein